MFSGLMSTRGRRDLFSQAAGRFCHARWQDPRRYRTEYRRLKARWFQPTASRRPPRHAQSMPPIPRLPKSNPLSLGNFSSQADVRMRSEIRHSPLVTGLPSPATEKVQLVPAQDL